MSVEKRSLKKVFAGSVAAAVAFFLGAMFGGAGPCTASLFGMASLGLCFLSVAVAFGCVLLGTYRAVMTGVAKRRAAGAR